MKKQIYLISFLIFVTFSQITISQSLHNQDIHITLDSLAFQINKAKVLIQQGKKEDASRILTNIMGSYPNNKEAVQWWLIANMKRSPTGEVEAIPMLDSLSKTYPSNTGILYFKIFIQAENGMNQEALTNTEKLIKIQPDSADNWILKGQILQGLDKHQDACKAFDKALILNSSRTDVWGMKASSLSKLGQYKESLALMNKIIEIYPNSAENYYNRGCIYCLIGDNKKALIDLKTAFNMNVELKKNALTDKDLKKLYDNKEFKELTK